MQRSNLEEILKTSTEIRLVAHQANMGAYTHHFGSDELQIQYGGNIDGVCDEYQFLNKMNSYWPQSKDEKLLLLS